MEHKIQQIMVRLFVLLAITLTLSCKPSAPKQNEETNSETTIHNDKQEKMATAEKETTTSKQYVIAPNGLNLRESANPSSKVLEKIAYGESVEVVAQTTGEKLEVDNIGGTMVAVNYLGEKGYLFSGYLSSIPVPDITIEYRDKMISSFVTSLKKAQFNANDSMAVKDESTAVRYLSIPSSSLEETFLIAKILFFIPESYHFPKEDKVVLSTPSSPSEAVLNSNYDYVSQSFEIKRKPGGEIQKLTYFNDNEVGGQNIAIEKKEAGFLLIVDDFSH